MAGTTLQKGTIRVAIVDDHPIVRAGIRAVLAAEADVQIAAEAAGGGDALRLARDPQLDVLILDVNLPDINGLEVTRRLRNQAILIPILILSVHNDEQTVLGVLEAGATGYVLKDEALTLLPNAVRAAARGETWLSPAVAAQVVRRAVRPPESPDPSSPLTPREREVLCLLAQGLDNEAIARQLVLTKRTVQNHISVIYDKICVSSRTEALLYAVQRGWVRLAAPGERPDDA